MLPKAFLTISLWSVLAISPSAVCLNGHATTQAEYEHSYGVFLGTVVAEQSVPAASKPWDQEGTSYTVRVDELLRGKLSGRVRVFSENSTGRFPMHVGTKYLLFVYRVSGRTMVDNCGNSEIFNAKSPTLMAVRTLNERSH
jgi:hypothetical protein